MQRGLHRQHEAYDNMKHPKALEKWVNKLNEDDFVNMSAKFELILHTIMLIWKNSAYYDTPSQLGERFDRLLNNQMERRQESTVVRTMMVT
jgi:hypothetical protein